MSYAAPFVDSDEVVRLIRDPTKVVGKDYIIVDVRDDDFIGGNIPGALNVPASKILDSASELAQKYSTVPKVYFHCALSQVRGPKSARIYNEFLHLQGISTQQQVMVIRRGFEGWQEKYKDDKDLMENYDAARWANGFF
ncbi:Rhodanese-like domain-containing protein [Absidia repens]|uniref:Rhodanese-like domain-containing protein n=1 Tax=Absidia repens TaxID=90262 RepID=A0A1X2IPF1_9FUNG|nr:Rhodanese-like domain-containing protein [Absidia repens]